MNIKTVAEHGVAHAEISLAEAKVAVERKLVAASAFFKNEMHDDAIKVLAQAKALVESIKVHLGKDRKANDPETSE